MKNLLKPFSHTLVASAIAMAFSQPVFASNIQSNTNQQQPRDLNKNKGKPVTNVQQQSKKPNTKNTKVSTPSVQNERSEIERITYEQRMNVSKRKQWLLPK